MPSKKIIRLIKIASEINVGKDTIVDYLVSRGFSIENKPTTVLTEDMVDIVFEKFQKEKQVAEQHRELLNKKKEKSASSLQFEDSEEFDVNDNVADEHFDDIKSEIIKPKITYQKNEQSENEQSENIENASDDDEKSTRTKAKNKVKDVKDLKNIIDMTPQIGDVIYLSEADGKRRYSRSSKTKDEEETKNKTTKTKESLTKKTTKGVKAEDKARRDKAKKEENKKVIQHEEEQEEKLASASVKIKKPKTKKEGEEAEIDVTVESSGEEVATKSSRKKTNDKISTVKAAYAGADDDESSTVENSTVKNDAKSSRKKEYSNEKEKDAGLTEEELQEKKRLRNRQKKEKDREKRRVKKAAEAAAKAESKSEEKTEKTEKTEEGKSTKKSAKKRNENNNNKNEYSKSGLKQEFTVLGKIEIDKEKVEEKVEEKTDGKEKFFKSRKGKKYGDRKDGQGDDRRDRRDGDRRDGRPFERRDSSTTYHHRRRHEDGDDRYPRRDGDNNQGGYQRRDGDNNQGGYQRREGGGDNRGGYQRREGGDSREYQAARHSDKKVFTNNAPPRGSKPTTNYDDKKKKRKPLKDSISSEDIDRAIRATLIGMEDSGMSGKKAKIKQKKKAVREEKEAKQQRILEQESKILKLTEYVTTSDLAAIINIKASEIILKCMQLGLMVTINQRLDKDTIHLIADDYGFEVEFIEETAFEDIIEEIDEDDTLVTRPPIVTIMGHVDHGKTSLLDHIRNANVIAGEAGGITQHIGAYRVILKNGKSITFLDTPGHEAFTAMRARGAQVTDIVVVVVAADDSVMPQTIEAISHAKAANVPIIVAINKIDKPEANIDRIKQQLSEQGILVEDWGGKFQCAEISAKKGTNVNILLDKILLEAEMLELKANPDRNAQGIIIESKMSKGFGNVATVIIQKGTLLIGDTFVAGANFGKIRALLDERGNKVEDVLPSQPVVIVGIDGLPEAGDAFIVVNSDSEAREIATRRRQLRREQDLRKVRHTTLDDISAQISIGGVRDLNLIVKGDVAGSVEALCDSLSKLATEEVRLNIILKGVGTITESDVMLATASSAIIIGFNTSSTPQAAKLAELETVEIRSYNIIYDCINDIHLALEGMLKPDIKEEICAVIEVRQTFKISKIGQIAGCYILNGKVNRNDKIRILRDGFPIFTGNIASLKRNKDDVREVDTNYECGIQVASFNSFEIGDIIEAIKFVEIKRTLTR